MNRSLCTLAVLLMCLGGCAVKNDVQEPAPLVPMPPLTNVAATTEKPAPPVAPVKSEEGQPLTSICLTMLPAVLAVVNRKSCPHFLK